MLAALTLRFFLTYSTLGKGFSIPFSIRVQLSQFVMTHESSFKMSKIKAIYLQFVSRWSYRHTMRKTLSGCKRLILKQFKALSDNNDFLDDNNIYLIINHKILIIIISQFLPTGQFLAPKLIN